MLDQFVVAVCPNEVVDEVTIKARNIQDVCYWQSEEGIQIWMETLYVQKGGTEIFNDGYYVHITADDVLRLENSIKNKAVKIFDTDNINEAIRSIKHTMRKGYSVCYTSSW